MGAIWIISHKSGDKLVKGAGVAPPKAGINLDLTQLLPGLQYIPAENRDGLNPSYARELMLNPAYQALADGMIRIIHAYVSIPGSPDLWIGIGCRTGLHSSVALSKFIHSRVADTCRATLIHRELPGK